MNDGKIVRIPIPPLTEERRKELAKLARKMAEDGKISIRNHRREANEFLKELKQEKEISEDEEHKAQEGIQKLTDIPERGVIGAAGQPGVLRVGEVPLEVVEHPVDDLALALVDRAHSDPLPDLRLHEYAAEHASPRWRTKVVSR